MRILIFSDTHRAMRKPFEIVRKIEQSKRINLFVHLGDCVEDGIEIGERFELPTIVLRGNNDFILKSDVDNSKCTPGRYGNIAAFNGGEDFVVWEDKDGSAKIIDTSAGKIYLTHGHRENVSLSVNNMVYKMEEKGCIAGIFGHTHMAMKEVFGDFLLVNPGSISKPRDDVNGSYAVMDIEGDAIDVEILRLGNDGKRRGGYVRNLINYSDRF